MLTLRPPTRQTLRRLWKLEVAEEQAGFVAPNLVTLAQAPYEGGAYPFGIWNGDEPVGFLALIDFRQIHEPEDGDPKDAAYLWRFMIAAPFQGKGYGRSALGLCFDWARGMCLPRIVTSAVEGNDVALRLYESAGFRRTGRIVDGEIELTRTL
ncbi:GNAT family N-acetyltransferase [Rhodobacterales bacterium HKCCE3408]|nr:GNAT family N-acetyltransferase [Rhodobacterales bacterium HKCCE3408]